MENTSCAVCNCPAPHTCSGCQSVRYCSKEHQKVHWRDHKANCGPYKLEWDVQVGQHLVARRDIKQGEIIVQEEPLLIVPKKTEGSAVCVGCCTELRGQHGKACPQCKWPMCGRKGCWGPGSQHTLGECSLLKAAGDGPPISGLTMWVTKGVYQGILVLRCLALKERDPAKYEKLLQLYFCESSSKVKVMGNMDRDVVVKLVNKWLPNTTIPKELVIKLCGIFAFNSFDISEVLGDAEIGLHALYAVTGMIDHSCVANAITSFTKKGKIVVRATVPITKGARIFLNYVEPMLPFGTLRRQYDLLSQTRFEDCRCDRCKDPTELATYLSAIYCTKCPNQEGILLSENPLSMIGDWSCSKCSDRKSVTSVGDLMGRIEKDLDVVNKDDNRENASVCEKYIKKYEKILHPNHYMLLSIKISLCHAYGKSVQRDPRCNRKDVMKKRELLAVELLKIIDVIHPGWNELRAVLLYHHFSALDIPQFNSFMLNRGKIPAKDLLPRFKLAQKVLKEALGIFALKADKTKESCRAMCFSPCDAGGHGGCEDGCHAGCPDTCPQKEECELKEVEFMIKMLEEEGSDVEGSDEEISDEDSEQDE